MTSCLVRVIHVYKPTFKKWSPIFAEGIADLPPFLLPDFCRFRPERNGCW